VLVVEDEYLDIKWDELNEDEKDQWAYSAYLEGNT